MKTLRTLIISVLVLLFFIGGLLFFVGYFSPKPGGIKIETTPNSSVFINGNLVGQTPYESTFKMGKIVLRLVPQGSEEPLLPYETSLIITSGIETVVSRNFAEREDKASGYVISFEKLKSKNTEFKASSQPENAQVLIDGVSKGFSPYETSSIAPAMHKLEVKFPGYKDFTVTIKTIAGYRLILYAKLAKDDIGNEVPSDNQNQKTVTILNTPTGYLRVRTKPGDSGSEIAQVKTGEKYVYIDTDVETGWVEIQYQAPKEGMPSGITGFVSGEYVSIDFKTE